MLPSVIGGAVVMEVSKPDLGGMSQIRSCVT